MLQLKHLRMCPIFDCCERNVLVELSIALAQRHFSPMDMIIQAVSCCCCRCCSAHASDAASHHSILFRHHLRNGDQRHDICCVLCHIVTPYDVFNHHNCTIPTLGHALQRTSAVPSTMKYIPVPTSPCTPSNTHKNHKTHM